MYKHTAALLHALETKGRHLGTDEYLQVQELLRRLPADTDPDTLLLSMAPLLARNPAEQEELYELFDLVKKEIAAIQAPLPAPAPPPPGLTRWKWRIAIPALFLLGFSGGIALYYMTRSLTPNAVLAFPARFGQERVESPAALPEIQAFGPIAFIERLYPLKENSPLGVFVIDSAAGITYTALDSAGVDSIVVRLNGAAGKTMLLQYKPYLEPAQPELPPSTVNRPPSTVHRLFEPKPDYPFEHDLLQFAVVETPDWQRFVARWWPWLQWIAALLFTLLLAAVWRYRAYKRRQLVAEQQGSDKPPYAWNIRIEGADELAGAENLRAAAQVLRRRARAEGADLDVPRTVEATAEAAGMPAFRFRRQTLPPEYLLLIDRQHGENHRARYYDLLYRGLRANEVEIARFFYDADPRVLFNEEHPQGITLGELQQRHGQSRLVLVGTGGQLLSPLSGRPAPWTGQFAAWKHRLLLTPRAAAEWGRDERRLAEQFTLLPAGLDSLQFWLEEIEQGDDARFDDWAQRLPGANRPPLVLPENPALLPTYLEAQLGTDMLRWIAACAVYPSLHWDLTMWLGATGTATPPPSPAPKGRGARPHFTHPSQFGMPMVDREQAPLPFGGGDGGGVDTPGAETLARLPWFVSGRMPREVRAALLDWYETTDPEGLRATRARIAALLSQNPPPRDSAAWDQYRMHVALNDWLSATDPTRKKQLEQEIAQLLENGAEADFTVVKHLDRPATPLDFLVPERWKKYVHPAGYRALGWLRDWKDLRWLAPLWLGALALCFWNWNLPGEACAEQRVSWTPREGGQAVELCLETPEAKLFYAEDGLLRALESDADSVIYSQSFTRFTASGKGSLKQQIIESDPGLLAAQFAQQPAPAPLPDNASGDSLFKAARATLDVYISFDSLYNQALANLAAALYNRGVVHYDRYEQGGGAAAPRDSACAYFRLAHTLDSLDDAHRRAAAWCRGETAKPLEALNGRVLDAATGQPVAGAQIRAADAHLTTFEALRAGTARNILRTSTTADGRFTLAGIPATNQLQFYVTAAGYQPATARMPLRDPLPDIRLSPGTAAVAQAVSITGRVQDAETGQGLGNVRVSAGYGEVLTDAAGRFALNFTPAGDYTGKALLTFDKTGYEPYSRYVLTPGNRADADFALEMTVAATPAGAPPKPAMVFVPGGTFRMGDTFGEGGSDELPVHEVTLGGFYISPAEVTFDEYDLFCQATGRQKPGDEGWGRGRRPVINVDWYDAIEYCNWLSAQHGYKPAYTLDKNRKDPNNTNTSDDKKWTVALVPGADGYRLPTEAEWEYAAKGGPPPSGGRGASRFGNGKDIADPKEINFDGSADYKKDYSVAGEYRGKTVPAGSLNSPNALGLHDMSGNVWEWCWDWYDEKQYEKDAKGARNPLGAGSGRSRVVRGGSWGDYPYFCRSSVRDFRNPYDWYSDAGFRVARH